MADIEKQKKQKEYQDYVKQVPPPHNLYLNMRKTLVVNLLFTSSASYLSVCSGLYPF